MAFNRRTIAKVPLYTSDGDDDDEFNSLACLWAIEKATNEFIALFWSLLAVFDLTTTAVSDDDDMSSMILVFCMLC